MVLDGLYFRCKVTEYICKWLSIMLHILVILLHQQKDFSMKSYIMKEMLHTYYTFFYTSFTRILHF